MLVILYTLVFLLFYVLITTYIERKIAARIQSRIGPNIVGIKGLLQPFADIIKLVQKKNIIPKSSSKWLFILAPILTFIAIFASLATIPLSNTFIFSNLNVGVYYSIAFLSIKILGVLIAGVSSYSKFSLPAAIRATGQLISYEIPLMLSLISALIISGSLNAQSITENQGILSHNKIYLLGIIDVTNIGGFLSWNIFKAPHLILSFLIFFIASMMASNRTPFDTLEAESELVAGYHVEYSSISFALFMLSEYLSMFILALLAATVFLGGWNSFFPNINLIKFAELSTGKYWSIFWLLSKTFLIVISQIWLKWVLPRLRPDQLMTLCWKYLVPISLINLIISMLWVILTR